MTWSDGQQEREGRVLRSVQAELTPQVVSREQAHSMVFGATMARSLLFTETPEDLVHLTAKRIWDNFETYFALGEWPVRSEVDIPDEHVWTFKRAPEMGWYLLDNGEPEGTTRGPFYPSRKAAKAEADRRNAEQAAS